MMKNKGNITLITVILSALVIGFGITVSSVLTSSVVSVRNISKATKAYYEAESGAEKGYYLFAGHLAGFEYNYDNDATCEIETGEDKWCLSSRVNDLPVDNTYGTIEDNGVLSIGLFNDISTTPFGTISTSNVDLTVHELNISLFPAEGETATSNNYAGVGDLRITQVVAGSTTYDEKSQVELGNSDINDPLENPTDSGSTCNSKKYAISGSDKLWDTGEFVYRDLDLSKDVSEGDVRMTTVGTYGAGTAVTAGDTDIGTLIDGDTLNIGCSIANNNYLYATDVAQIIISGRDNTGNRSIVHVLSKNQLSGTSQTSPYMVSKTTTANVGEQYTNCNIAEFINETTTLGDCNNDGEMQEPQLEIYSFSSPIKYRVESTFSDFRIDNSASDCTLCDFISIAGTAGTSTDYNESQSSTSNVSSFIDGASLELQIMEYGSGKEATSAINVFSTDTGSDVALKIQNALNNTSNLKNRYSVSYRNAKFYINSTGITLTNPETTLVSKGTIENFQQSIETSITDSSLVPIFGWYSVF